LLAEIDCIEILDGVGVGQASREEYDPGDSRRDNWVSVRNNGQAISCE
jgi:hypothetical protein